MAPVEKPPRIDPARVQQEQEEGRKAGIAFATDEAEYRDLLMLRKFLESPCDSDFAAELFSHYPDLSYGEFADRLFGDEEAEPSDDFILAFARAAVEVLEEIERRKLTGWGRLMNALDPTVAEFRERLKHQRTEKRRRLNAMIDGATDDQVRDLLDRHTARMERYVTLMPRDCAARAEPFAKWQKNKKPVGKLRPSIPIRRISMMCREQAPAQELNAATSLRRSSIGSAKRPCSQSRAPGRQTRLRESFLFPKSTTILFTGGSTDGTKQNEEQNGPEEARKRTDHGLGRCGSRRAG